MSDRNFLVHYQTGVGGPSWGIEPAHGPLVKPLFDDKRVKVFALYELLPEIVRYPLNALIALAEDGTLKRWTPPPRVAESGVTGEPCRPCFGYGFVRVLWNERLSKSLCPDCNGVGRVKVAA